jgi:hypothetical protein
MVERVTYKEVLERFPNEYVLLGELEADEQLRPVSGVLLSHSPSRAEVRDAAIKLRPRHSAFFYTGKPPTNVAIAL